jgi:uridine kinase
VIAIDGRSGAGNSTLAAALAGRLPAALVALEDLYGGWDGLQDGVGRLCGDVLSPFAQGRAARVPRYDWGAGAWLEPRTLQPPEILIVEGVGAGALAAAPYTSLLVWVHAPAALRLERALTRRPGDAHAWERWARQEDAYVERERPQERADFVVQSAEGVKSSDPA